MKKRHVFLSICLALTGIANLSAQSDGQDCKAPLQAYVRKMAAYNKAPGAGQAYYLHAAIEVEYNPAAGKPAAKTEIQIHVSDGKVSCESGYMAAYLDRDDVFTVVHPQRMIYRSNGGNNALALQNAQAVALLQDSLLRTSRVTACRSIKEQGKSLQEITVEPRESVRKAKGISTIQFYYDPAARQLTKVVNTYAPDRQVQRETITYYAVDFNSKRKVGKTARANIMASNGKLLPAYKNYTLIDNRQ